MTNEQRLATIPEQTLYEQAQKYTIEEMAEMNFTSPNYMSQELKRRGIKKPRVQRKTRKVNREFTTVRTPKFEDAVTFFIQDGTSDTPKREIEALFDNPVLKVDIRTGAISGSWAGKHLTALGWR